MSVTSTFPLGSSDDHSAHDVVVGIELRPMIEQVFHWQQRMLDSTSVTLRLELECEQIDWFPVRLRHILDNLISNSVRLRHSDQEETRVTVAFRMVFDSTANLAAVSE